MPRATQINQQQADCTSVYPVGRLDKDTSGLIVLTSDGRMVNSVLRGERKQEKVYNVMVNGRLDDEHLQLLRVLIQPTDRIHSMFRMISIRSYCIDDITIYS